MAIALTIALAFALLPQAQQPDAKAESLFDGRTLAGWDGEGKLWSVRDGCIVGSTVGTPIERNTFLVWGGGELQDFEFAFDVRIEGDNNSGVQYRSEVLAGGGHVVHGYQCDIFPSPDYCAQLYDEGGRGILANRGQQAVCAADGAARVVGATTAATAVDLAKWHHFVIRARGTQLVHELDGVVAVRVDDQFAKARRRGVLALQLHAGAAMTVWFKNLNLVRLPAEEVAQTQAPAAQGTAPVAQWIWDEQAQDGEEVFFRRAFALPAAATNARLSITCDNHCRVYLDGEQIAQSDDWAAPRVVDVVKALTQGAHVLAVHGWNDGGPAGLVARLDWLTGAGDRGTLVTDADWRCFADDPDGWNKQSFDDAKWAKVHVLGALGARGTTWTAALPATAFDDALADLEPQRPRPAPELTLAPGWTAQKLLRVPRSMGSWVSLAQDGRGRIYASDQGRGLYRVTLAGLGRDAATIEHIDVDLDGCHGLLWAHDCLYAVANGGRSGLYRVTDTNGDDVLDKVELLRKLDGEGEHGPHSIALDPDREHLLVLCGNHTKLTELAASRLPRNWAEDLLMPRIEDPNGHANGVMAPGGYLCRVDRDGKQWEMITSGFRNAFDFAVAPDGEIYAFDADMEWDMGLPWYRPTRICHCVSGAEFGWRNGSGKWPADYPDSLPPVCDIGPGSPTGMLATGGAIYALDWTFGTLWDVTPVKSGASSRAVPKQIASGQPFPLCDAIAIPGSDGMFVLTGGRGLPSTLYRLDPPPSAGAGVAPVLANDLAPIRRKLEAFHGHADANALAAAWPHLGDDDVFLRYAARIAVEWQPVAEWRARARAEASSPWAQLTALLALARQGGAEDLAPVLDALGAMSFAKLDQLQQVAWARVHQLALLRLGKPDAELAARTAAHVLAVFPCGRDRVDQELCAVACALDAPGIVDKALPLVLREGAPPPPQWAQVIARNPGYGNSIAKMMADMPPAPQILLAFDLRTVAHGWTLEQREGFFRFLAAARKKPGGNSYGGYLSRIWKDAMAGCTPAERAALAPVVGEKLPELPPFVATPAKGPGRDWQLADAVAAVKKGATGRNFERGRNLFHAVSCATCHRFAGEGGNVGPDLTSLGNKFAAADVLEAVLQPSKIVSDQYAGSVLTKKDGTTVFGRLQRTQQDGVDVWVGTAADAKATPLRVPAAEVAKVEPSKLSPMPTGLANPLSEDELQDLLAFLLSRGDAKGPAFAK